MRCYSCQICFSSGESIPFCSFCELSFHLLSFTNGFLFADSDAPFREITVPIASRPTSLSGMVVARVCKGSCACDFVDAFLRFLNRFSFSICDAAWKRDELERILQE